MLRGHLQSATPSWCRNQFDIFPPSTPHASRSRVLGTLASRTVASLQRLCVARILAHCVLPGGGKIVEIDNKRSNDVHRIDNNFWIVWSFIGLIYSSESLYLARPGNIAIQMKHSSVNTWLFCTVLSCLGSHTLPVVCQQIPLGKVNQPERKRISKLLKKTLTWTSRWSLLANSLSFL